MTYMFILKCALKLVEEINLYYDARSKKHKKNYIRYLIVLVYVKFVMKMKCEISYREIQRHMNGFSKGRLSYSKVFTFM